jgi:glycosyltransferase involved in cell wall biosynthesis
MRISLDATGRDVSAWAAALRRQSRGEEIVEFQSSPMVRLLGPAGLDWAIRGTDVFHAAPSTPAGPRRAKLTATVEDLSCWLMPDLHTPAQMKTAALFSEKILTQAHGLIAVSDTARRDAIRLLGVAPEKVTIIYPGVDASFFDARPAPRPRPYVLCTGDPLLRANSAAVQEAWRGVPEELRREYDLVTFDKTQPAELPGLFAGATLFVHVPFHESFALPVAQAMAAHVALVISSTSGLPETGRDAGLMVDPHSSSEIAAAITRLLESESERAKLARYGRARAELYRWEKCASESLAFFHRIAGR